MEISFQMLQTYIILTAYTYEKKEETDSSFIVMKYKIFLNLKQFFSKFC
jgi:hypothetical protein